jgi:hypothetical protein
MTDKKISCFWGFTQPVQPMEKTSGYFVVSFIIVSEAHKMKEISFCLGKVSVP